jgi:signal peptidase I
MSDAPDIRGPEAPIAPPDRPRALERKRRDDALSRKLAIWLVGPLATLLAAIILIFFVLFETATVSGPSMVPTLLNGDYVLATKGDPDPHRGDVVLLNMLNPKTGVREEWVKRVVAIPGDEVYFDGDNIVVNGTAVDYGQIISNMPVPTGHVTVQAGKVFLAGDNRPVSEDSRRPEVGTVPISQLRGRVVFVYAPLWRMGPVVRPNP